MRKWLILAVVMYAVVLLLADLLESPIRGAFRIVLGVIVVAVTSWLVKEKSR